jgi:hypothetical protein
VSASPAPPRRGRSQEQHVPDGGRAQPVRQPGLCTRKGALSFVTTICSSYRESPYKRECGRENDRRPSSKPADASRQPAGVMSVCPLASRASATWNAGAQRGGGWVGGEESRHQPLQVGSADRAEGPRAGRRDVWQHRDQALLRQPVLRVDRLALPGPKTRRIGLVSARCASAHA